MRLLISRLRNSHLIYKNVIVYLLIKCNRKCNETLFHRKIKTKKNLFVTKYVVFIKISIVK